MALRTGLFLAVAALGLVGCSLDPEGDELRQSRLPLADLARRNRVTVEKMELLLQDPTVRLDSTGVVYWVDPRPLTAGIDRAPRSAGAEPLNPEQVFRLHSSPGSQRVIYLDFDGAIISDSLWNGPGLPSPYWAPGFTLDSDPSSFTGAELSFIQSVFQRVAEDFAPFDIDVTTENPGLEAIDRSDVNDPTYGTTVLITSSGYMESQVCPLGCGGVAALGVFDIYPGRDPGHQMPHQYFQPALVFLSGVGLNEKYVAEAVSHEAGHTLGLSHDGDATSAYHRGNQVWAPIMGVGYYSPVVQWSRGEYPGANNFEDDFQVIASHGGRIWTNDHDDSIGTATRLPPRAEVQVPGTIVSDADRNFFAFDASGDTAIYGMVAGWNFIPSSPNLDMRLVLYDRFGQIIELSDPPVSRVNDDFVTGLDASISRTLSSGRYYLSVEGVGAGSWYPGYGSVGKYLMTVFTGVPLDGIGTFRPSSAAIALKNEAAAGAPDQQLVFGAPGDLPITGDWDGDGKDTIGIFRSGVFYLRSSNQTGYADYTFPLGLPGDLPIAGDWDGDGKDTVGVYRDGSVFLTNTLASGPVTSFTFGVPGDLPIAGDWNCDGVDTIGIYRPSTGVMYLRQSNTTGYAQLSFLAGVAGDRPVAGDWDRDCTDTTGVYRNGVFHLRNANTADPATLVFEFGASGDLPLAGDWDAQ